MLENPSIDSSAAATAPTVRRYAPPNQRNRSLGRRKSGGEGLERANSYGNNEERNQISAAKTAAAVNQGDLSRSRKNEYSPGRLLIQLPGCCNSEAFQVLNDRWAAAMHAHTILPEDSSERPVLYSRRSAPPPRAMLPHMLMQPGIDAGSHKDFLNELRNAVHSFRGNYDAKDLRSSRLTGEDQQFHLKRVIR